MTSVHISASKNYDVIIDRKILSRIGKKARELGSRGKAVIVSGENVFPLYGAVLKASLEDAGFEVLCFIHKSGESAKSLAVYGELQNFLCENRLSRTDTLFALGGGVTGDLTGFAAATYQRGIAFYQIPTTLLAAVDSSVGGKTAINLQAAKNQVGCFYQPSAVFCDPDVFKTLPREEYRCGCAEIIKYGVLGDGEFFSFLEKNEIRDNEEAVIAHCVKMKRDIVEQDEFDKGARKLLNLGHTIGHAVEKLSGFETRHGDAIAIGLSAVMRGAEKLGFCKKEDRERVIALLEKNGLPTKLSYSAQDIVSCCTQDKKIEHGKLGLIVPTAIGSCEITPMEPEKILSWLNND